MRAITHGLVLRLPATTERCHSILFCDVFYGCELTALVAAIAEWLIRTLTTGAPEIALARLKFHPVGTILC